MRHLQTPHTRVDSLGSPQHPMSLLEPALGSLSPHFPLSRLSAVPAPAGPLLQAVHAPGKGAFPALTHACCTPLLSGCVVYFPDASTCLCWPAPGAWCSSREVLRTGWGRAGWECGCCWLVLPWAFFQMESRTALPAPKTASPPLSGASRLCSWLEVASGHQSGSPSMGIGAGHVLCSSLAWPQQCCHQLGCVAGARELPEASAHST